MDLPLAKMTLAQKLDLIEALWGDISKGEKALESPGWHEEVLRDRQQAVGARMTSSKGERGRSPYEMLALGVCVCDNVYYGS